MKGIVTREVKGVGHVSYTNITGKDEDLGFAVSNYNTTVVLSGDREHIRKV